MGTKGVTLNKSANLTLSPQKNNYKTVDASKCKCCSSLSVSDKLSKLQSSADLWLILFNNS